VPEKLSWPAPAKINLFLHITGRRPDGYHDLQTVFQLLDWGDEIAVDARADGRIVRTVDLPGVPEDKDLSIRAAWLLKKACGTALGANIGITKRIPAGAGLGGASSDAATALHALNRAWSCGMEAAGLADLALQLGADVPLFVHGHSAWAEGIGEHLQPVDLGTRHYLLLFPEFTVSTAEVFAAAGLKRDSQPVSLQDFMADDGQGALRNDCESVVLDRHPELRNVLEEASRWGRVRMTGTGGVFFLEFDDEKALLQAASSLKSRYNVRAVGGVNRSPLLERLTRG